MGLSFPSLHFWGTGGALCILLFSPEPFCILTAGAGAGCGAFWDLAEKRLILPLSLRPGVPDIPCPCVMSLSLSSSPLHAYSLYNTAHLYYPSSL